MYQLYITTGNSSTTCAGFVRLLDRRKVNYTYKKIFSSVCTMATCSVLTAEKEMIITRLAKMKRRLQNMKRLMTAYNRYQLKNFVNSLVENAADNEEQLKIAGSDAAEPEVSNTSENEESEKEKKHDESKDVDTKELLCQNGEVETSYAAEGVQSMSLAEKDPDKASLAQRDKQQEQCAEQKLLAMLDMPIQRMDTSEETVELYEKLNVTNVSTVDLIRTLLREYKKFEEYGDDDELDPETRRKKVLLLKELRNTLVADDFNDIEEKLTTTVTRTLDETDQAFISEMLDDFDKDLDKLLSTFKMQVIIKTFRTNDADCLMVMNKMLDSWRYEDVQDSKYVWYW